MSGEGLLASGNSAVFCGFVTLGAAGPPGAAGTAHDNGELS